MKTLALAGAIYIGDIVGPIIVLLVIIILLGILASNVKVVQQSKAVVIERLGAFRAVWGVGLHIKVPFIERVAKTVSLKEQVVDFDPQPVITKDNVTMHDERHEYWNTEWWHI